MAPLVSLIVVNYNGRAVLPDCLASLAALDWPSAALEVILVDNASSDGSPELALEQLPGLRLLVVRLVLQHVAEDLHLASGKVPHDLVQPVRPAQHFIAHNILYV